MHILIDSAYASLREALVGIRIPRVIRSELALVTVQYVSFDGHVHQGQMVIHRDLVRDVKEIFIVLLDLGFPIARVIPIVKYGWNDDRSMAANNSSSFNYRLILGTDRLSNHSFGRALDLNPKQNPYFARDGLVYPPGSTYDPSVPGTLTKDGPVVALFKERGWMWGGDWDTPVDFQHLEKPL